MNPFLDLVTERLTSGAALWAKDLRAIDPECITKSAGGSARTVADIVWETVLVNRRMSARLSGGTPEPMDGFPPCPAEFANAESLIELIDTSAKDVLAAAGTDPDRTVTLASGPKNAFALAEFASMHMFYHLGQVNYLQTLKGDCEIHW